MGCEMCKSREPNYNTDPVYQSNSNKDIQSQQTSQLYHSEENKINTPKIQNNTPLSLDNFDSKNRDGNTENNYIITPSNQENETLNALDSSLLSKQNFNEQDESNEVQALFSQNLNSNNSIPNQKPPAQYLSMSNPNLISKSPFTHETNQGASTALKAEELLTQCTVIFYIELSFFALWNIPYIRLVYPEGKLYYCIKFDEDESSYEKIPLVKIKTNTKPKNEIYIPLTSDISSPNLRIVKPISHSNLSIKPHKITNELCILTKGKMITITEDEYYIYISKDFEMTKIQFYLNSNTLYSNKKIGNANFFIMYKIDAIENLTPSEEKIKEYIKMFQDNKDKLTKYNEEPSTQLIYYNIPNKSIRKNTNNVTSNDQFKSFDTLKCLYDIPKLLRESSPSVPILLEILKSSDILKYDLYEVVKRLNFLLGNPKKNNFEEDNLMQYKELLFKVHNDYVTNIDIWDKITIPYLFHTFRKVFFSNSKAKDGNILNDISPHYMKRHTDIVFSIFKTSFIYVETVNDNKSVIDVDIPLSAINYIAKNIENGLIINQLSNQNLTDDLFLPFIISQSKYIKLIQFLLNTNLSKNESVLPVFLVITALLKYTNKSNDKSDEQTLLKILTQDGMKQAFQKIATEHNCNSLIMNSMFCIFKLLAENLSAKEMFEILPLAKIKEIFISFKLSFEILHENIIFFIKTILKHNSEQMKAEALTTNYFTDSHYEDIISIFVYSIQLIKIKIQTTSDLIHLTKNSYNIFMNMYTCCSIINNINEQNSTFAIKACIQNKFGDLVLDCLSSVNDKGALCQIDYMLAKNEITSIATKTMLFRLLYHTLVLIENLYKINENALAQTSMKKMINLFCVIEESDNIYNPKEIIKSINQQNAPLVNQVKGLHEYFIRYKAKVPEIKELLRAKLTKNSMNK